MRMYMTKDISGVLERRHERRHAHLTRAPERQLDAASGETPLEQLMGLAAVRQNITGIGEDEAIRGVLRDYPALRAAWHNEMELRDVMQGLTPRPSVTTERQTTEQKATSFYGRIAANKAGGMTETAAQAAAAHADPEGYKAHVSLSTAGGDVARQLAARKPLERAAATPQAEPTAATFMNRLRSKEAAGLTPEAAFAAACTEDPAGHKAYRKAAYSKQD